MSGDLIPADAWVFPAGIPKHVKDAALTLEIFFAEQGINDWALMGVCSRTMYEKLKASAKTVTTENTLQHIASKQ